MKTNLNTIIHGDCIELMQNMTPGIADFILTDPPYITRYRDRGGRTVCNDDNAAWLKPAFQQMHRLLKDNAFCVSFYGWNKADLFIDAWRSVGFGIVGHLVFRKRYASSTRFVQYRHEQAYLLAKGNPPLPEHPIPDVIDWAYTGNRLHPTQKPLEALKPLVRAFSRPGDVILDPFCGSGSSLRAAQELGRNYIGIELDPAYHQTAANRLADFRRAS